jgi:hypothetical protein
MTPTNLADVVAINEIRPQNLPQIVTTGRQLREITDSALNALEAANTPPSVFMRGGELVRVVADENGRPKVEPFSEAGLRGRLSRVANFFRHGGQGLIAIHPPAAVVKDILALGEWNFPGLNGVVEVPVLTPDGRIIDQPGYDAESRLFYWPAKDLKVPPLPEHPTAKDVEGALATLDEALGEFPYDSPASKANAIATLLTPVVRPAIKGPVPLALLDAPQQGSGKSLLASVIGLVATGRPTAMMAATDSEEEWRKRITATLRSGASVITIDNLEGQLKSPSLALALTSDVWRDRLLGVNESIELPQLATWLATGNNIRLGGDLQRRCYWIRLDAQSATPWLGRKFKHEDLKGWVRENRGQLLGALLTLARAWFAAGRPAPKSSERLGSYEDWSQVIGGILQTAGVNGFLGNLASLYSFADEEAADWAGFLEALFAEFNAKPFTTADLVEILEEDEKLRGVLPDELAADWKDRKGAGFAKRLGKAFSKQTGRRYGDFQHRIEPAGTAGHAKRWAVARTLPANTVFKAA